MALFRTKREAADTLEISTDQLTRYIKGQASPPLSVLMRLSAAKGVSLDWLATGEGPMRAESAPPPAAPEGAAAAVDEDLYGKVTEAVSMAYKECGYTATLRQVAARAARIAAGITAAGGTPDQQEYGLRLAVDQLRRDLRAAIANPTGDIAGGQKA